MNSHTWLVCSGLNKPKAKLVLENKRGIAKDEILHAGCYCKGEPTTKNVPDRTVNQSWGDGGGGL